MYVGRSSFGLGSVEKPTALGCGATELNPFSLSMSCMMKLPATKQTRGQRRSIPVADAAVLPDGVPQPQSQVLRTAENGRQRYYGHKALSPEPSVGIKAAGSRRAKTRHAWSQQVDATS